MTPSPTSRTRDGRVRRGGTRAWGNRTSAVARRPTDAQAGSSANAPMTATSHPALDTVSTVLPHGRRSANRNAASVPVRLLTGRLEASGQQQYQDDDEDEGADPDVH